MCKVKLTVLKSNCRCKLMKAGEEFIVSDACPPICHELFYAAYPAIYTIKNGGTLDYHNTRATAFDILCPDEGRVLLHGEKTD